MGIKLIATDIDGTLIDLAEKIPQQLVDTVRKCREYGIHFVLVTGRTKELVDQIVKTLEISDPYVVANGACIFRESQCIYSQGFQAVSILNILKEADQDGMTVTFSNEYAERAIRQTDYVRWHQEFGGRFKTYISLEDIDWRTEQFQKIMIMDENRTGKIEKYQRLMNDHREEYWVTTYSDMAVELGPKACNKATGLKALTDIMGIRMEEVMACGDFLNDLEMVKAAGIGVAVANAAPELKAAADYVAREQYCYGVMEAIEKYCF